MELGPTTAPLTPTTGGFRPVGVGVDCRGGIPEGVGPGVPGRMSPG